MKIFVNISVVAICLVTFANGCQQGGRKKRSVPTAPEVDTKLAEFFEDCLKRPASGIFQSLRSVVDSVIRDSVWYEEVDDDVCSGGRDVAECWIYTLPFLLDTQSTLYQPTAQCICDWAGTCFDPPSHTEKRSIYSFSPPSNDPPPKRPRQKPLSPTLERFSRCVDKNSRPLIRQYPSLKKISGKSISIFLRDHYTFCRSIPEFPYAQRNLLELLYLDRLCPRKGSKASWRRDTLQVYKEYPRKDGPLWNIVDQCHAPPKDPCRPSPCKNHGKCIKLGGDSYKCNCYYGYDGKHCTESLYVYRSRSFGDDDDDCTDDAKHCAFFTRSSCPYGQESICRKSCGMC